MNILGSFTLCFPAASSISRSAIVGNPSSFTPLHGFFTCLIIAIILDVPGQPLQYLPKPTPAAVVVMAFKGLLLNGIAEAKNLWNID